MTPSVDQLLTMTAEEQAAVFRARVIALYGPEEAEELLDPGPEPEAGDEGPDWRGWRKLQDAAWELADSRVVAEL